MAKPKTIFTCNECGYQAPKWSGQCGGCGAWNTLTEETLAAPTAPLRTRNSGVSRQPIPIREARAEQPQRIQTGIAELDRVLSGGLVEGGATLLGGEPGVGKSTILLQACQSIAQNGQTVLYISGEESVRQVALRAKRLQADSDQLFLLAETNAQDMIATMLQQQPAVCVIDSIQTAYLPELSAAPGSVSQVRECAASLVRVAKEEGISLLLVGHVTKEGTLAGPRVLEHMVDTVLYFEGERQTAMRILRAAKNRFGATDEIGIFEMGNDGMEGVSDASAYLLESMAQDVSGVAVASPMEGTRPVLCEVQALSVETTFQNPRRMAQGVDFNRLSMLLAVLERRGGVVCHKQDMYVNAVGGVRLSEPSCDLAIIGAMASTVLGMPVRGRTVLLGEVGLSGEVRPVAQMARRMAECARMGFDTVIAPPARGVRQQDFPEMHWVKVENIGQALTAMLQKKSSS